MSKAKKITEMVPYECIEELQKILEENKELIAAYSELPGLIKLPYKSQTRSKQSQLKALGNNVDVAEMKDKFGVTKYKLSNVLEVNQRSYDLQNLITKNVDGQYDVMLLIINMIQEGGWQNIYVTKKELLRRVGILNDNSKQLSKREYFNPIDDLYEYQGQHNTDSFQLRIGLNNAVTHLYKNWVDKIMRKMNQALIFNTTETYGIVKKESDTERTYVTYLSPTSEERGEVDEIVSECREAFGMNKGWSPDKFKLEQYYEEINRRVAKHFGDGALGCFRVYCLSPKEKDTFTHLPDKTITKLKEKVNTIALARAESSKFYDSLTVESKRVLLNDIINIKSEHKYSELLPKY